MKKQWVLPVSLVAAIIVIIVVVSSKIEFPQNSEATKPLWAEVKTSIDPLQTSAGVSEFLYLFKNLAKKLDPAVVNIFTTTTVKQQPFAWPFDFFENDPFFDEWFGVPNRRRQPRREPREFKQRSLGSGFIINEDGYILTNNHVVSGADEIKVRLMNDKIEYDAKVVGKDEKTDLALIQIKAKRKLPFLPLGDSSKLETAEWVMAIGNAAALGNTVTIGIISYTGRSLEEFGVQHPYYNFIQTDAAINPGNSGGPLINTNGEVIGINTAILKDYQGVGFAIPINTAKDLLPQLKEGKVVRGWLGIGLDAVTPEMRKKFNLPKDQEGVVVTQVFEGDPADKAGIKPWDIIVEFEGKKIKEPKDLVQEVGRLTPGKKAKVKILRDGKFLDLEMTVTERKEETLAKKSSKDFSQDIGISVAQITNQLANELDLSTNKGVVVTEVEAASAAEEAGLRRGDIILDIDRKAIKTLKDYNALVSSFKEEEAYFFRVQRGAYSTFLTKVVVPKKEKK